MTKAILPNTVTLINLLAGAAALLFLLYGHLEGALWLVLVSLGADFLDGGIARALDAQSELGKQLDSLADVVSFGVVPGVMMYGLLAAAYHDGQWPDDLEWRALPGLLLAAFSALRLGKFNLDSRQSSGFIGLPTPACALFIAGLLLIFLYVGQEWTGSIFQPWVLYVLTGLLCWLMVAEFPMFALKFKHFAWVGNEIKYIFVAVSIALLFVLKEAAPSAIILLYIGLSMAVYFPTRKQQR